MDYKTMSFKIGSNIQDPLKANASRLIHYNIKHNNGYKAHSNIFKNTKRL